MTCASARGPRGGKKEKGALWTASEKEKSIIEDVARGESVAMFHTHATLVW